jgi:hypothetical protein
MSAKPATHVSFPPGVLRPAAPEYFSFLLCFHAGVTNVYYNGRPVGVIRGGKFEVHQFVMPDQTTRPLTVKDLGDPCPFKSIDDLKEHVIAAVRAIQI